MKISLHRPLFVFIFIFILVFTAGCQAQELPPVGQEQPTQEVPATPEPSATPVPTATPTEAPTATPTETPLPDAEQSRATIVQSMLALNSQPNRMTVTTTLQDGTTSTNIIEFVPPDRKRIVSPDVDMEYVIIGEVVYMKVAGMWITAQIPATTFMGEATTEETLTSTVSEPQFLRLDELDGRPMVVYGYQSTTVSEGIELHSQIEMWIGLADGLVYQMVTDGETLSVSTDANGQSVSLAVPAHTVTMIEYDSAISIEPPIP